MIKKTKAFFIKCNINFAEVIWKIFVKGSHLNCIHVGTRITQIIAITNNVFYVIQKEGCPCCRCMLAISILTLITEVPGIFIATVAVWYAKTCL